MKSKPRGKGLPVPRVLIYEYVTGGGFIESPFLPAISSEAYAMLNALVKDFSRNAGWDILLILDKRIAENAQPAASRITTISSDVERERAFKSIVPEADAVLVVAPETNETLTKLTKSVEDSEGAALLGSHSEALRVVSDKVKAGQLAKSLGVAVPETVSITVGEGEKAFFSAVRDIGFPVVVKPQDGAGCENVFMVRDRQDLSEALEIAAAGKAREPILVQEYVKGVDASVSILVSKGCRPVPLSLNRQIVELSRPREEKSRYEGGYTPFDHALKLEAFDSATKIVGAVAGLNGYLGIDFVLTEEKPVFMEVNARITTSYVGLSRVLLTDGREGVAPAIIDAATSDKLPSHIVFRGLAYYSKFKLKSDLKVDRDMVDVLSNLDYVESPPFLDQEGDREVFLVNMGESLNEALNAKSRNEEKLEKITAKLEKH